MYTCNGNGRHRLHAKVVIIKVCDVTGKQDTENSVCTHCGACSGTPQLCICTPLPNNQSLKRDLETSKQLASGFNSFSNTNKPVKFADVEIQQVTKVADNSRVRLNEYITVEEYIPGDYIKWCNNYGVIDTRSTSMPALFTGHGPIPRERQ